MKIIGQRLKDIRKSMKMSQADFSELLGIQINALQSFEFGNMPSQDVLEKLSDLGVDLNWLFTGTGTMNRQRSQHNNELDRILIWNVAYYMSKHYQKGNHEYFADKFMTVFDRMHEIENENALPLEELESQDNVIDLCLHRLTV